MTPGSVVVLHRDVYDTAIASSVLRVPESTLRWWVEGGERRGKVYAPVLRPEPSGSSMMTWGEVVEAGYLAGYRKRLRVELWRLRDFVTLLRGKFGVPYPLASARPWVGPGRQLLVEASEEAGLPPELRPGLLDPVTGQGVLTGIADRFLARVEFEPPDAGGVAVRIRPLGKDSPIVIDPDVRFGVPSVGGVSTAVLAEKVSAGEPIEALADSYDLELGDVVAALNYEATEWPLLLTA